MIKEIIDFENDLLERMSRSYYDELLYFTAIIPEALINFNDILLLKKGQKYVSHTNLIFQKSIAELFKSLSKRIDLVCSVCKTDGGNGRGVYIKSKKMRWHFVGQEKFVNFPRVSWFNFKEGNGDCFDLYAVMIQKNNKGEGFIEKANEILKKNKIVTKKFVLLEDFVTGEFGLETWTELKKAMNDIEIKIKKYQWFGLVNYYNDLTKTSYLSEIEKRLTEFDYRSGLINSAASLTNYDISVLQEKFIAQKGYKILLGEEDFANSFITSEWLFDNFNRDDLLEKTYIVTGYTKSIEQLMAYMIRRSSDKGDQIGILAREGIKKVDIQSKDFYRATLGNMLYYLKLYSSKHIYIDEVSDLAIKNSMAIIKEWISTERNGYFHKDNIQTVKRVQEIKEKTYLLYYLLIALIKI